MIEGGLEATQRTPEMCPIHAHFKHFQAPKAKEFHERCKLPSIM